jgi:biopolymer transport protein ExbB
MRNPKSIIFGLILTACFLLGMASGAWAWWDNNWEYRRKIAFDTTAAGSDIKDNLSDIPILIRLHSGNFNFDNAKENGSDIRFLGEDDKTPLKYHFERFDSIDGIGLIWVSIPKLSGESNQNFVWMYYGNKSAVDAQDTKGSYDVNYALVYHLAEVEGAPKDATAFDNNSSQFTGGQGLPSLIGNGISLNGAGDRIVIPVSPSLDFSGGFTFSTWIRVHQAQEHAYLFSWEEGEQAVLIGIKGTRIYSDISAEKDRTFKTDKSVDLPLNSWQRLAVTVVPNGRLTVYLEGVEMYWMNVPSQMHKLKGNIYIGGS